MLHRQHPILPSRSQASSSRSKVVRPFPFPLVNIGLGHLRRRAQRRFGPRVSLHDVTSTGNTHGTQVDLPSEPEALQP